jgi:hypothetical protein
LEQPIYYSWKLHAYLQPLGEVERDEMPQVEALGGGPPPGVEVKLLPLLVRGDDLVQLAVREEHPAAQERVRLAPRDVESGGTKLHGVDQLYTLEG